MKTLISTILIILTISCKAQILTFSIDDWHESKPNVYYKDLNNEFDDFEGTWLYSNGNTYLKIILRKETMYFNGNYFKDLIVGEYQYIENGVEIINTLSNINNPVAFEHKISGQNLYYDCLYIPISDCVDGETILDVSMIDANVDNFIADLILVKRSINGQEALRGYYSFSYIGGVSQDSTIPEPTITPTQDEIILIKQD